MRNPHENLDCGCAKITDTGVRRSCEASALKRPCCVKEIKETTKPANALLL